MTIKARIRGGRLLVDEPTDLPDGTEVECCRSIPAIGSMKPIGPHSMIAK